MSERRRRFFSISPYVLLGFASVVPILCPRYLTPFGLVSARATDDRLTRFLYADFPGNAGGAVTEYQIHTTRSGDYERDDADGDNDDDGLGLGRRRRPPGSEYEEQQHVRPYFLESDVEDPRVVQFYSPWCGRCRGLRSTYAAVADDVVRRYGGQEHHPVAFHAVSCSAHHWVCETYGAREFPTVRAYKAGSFEGTTLDPDRFEAEYVAEALGIALEPEGPRGRMAAQGGNEKIGGDAGSEDDDQFASTTVGSGGNLDIRGASIDVYKRTKNDLYKDAALSFSHALKTEVFTMKDTSLPQDHRDALSEWLDLLYWTLPPTWQLHTLIHDLRSNLHAALESKASLVQLVDAHAPVVHGTDRPKWTNSCTGSSGTTGSDDSDDSAGYRCGLWALFHIMSVGVTERHAAVLGARERVTTAHVARTLRDYVEHFGGGNSICGHRSGGDQLFVLQKSRCQKRVLEIFDSCGFNNCRRFQQRQKKRGGAAGPPPPETWNEFPLFLWEVHNELSSAPIKERAKEEGRKADMDELQPAMWPSKANCRRCWHDRGGWNRDAILSYLKSEYWPGGVQNFRFVVLGKKDTSKAEPEQRLWSNLGLSFMLAIVLMSSVLYSEWQKVQSGRHKKIDDHSQQ